MILIDGLKKIALKRLEEESDYFLILWWSNKYKLPDNHPLLLSKTREELYIDYLVDCFANNPELAKSLKNAIFINIHLKYKEYC